MLSPLYTRSICQEGSQAISFHREALLGKMGEVEIDSSAVVRHSENLRGALRRLIRDKNLSVSRAREATDRSCLLQERLCDLDSSMRSLKQLIKAQQKLEVRGDQELTASRCKQRLINNKFEIQNKLPPWVGQCYAFNEKIGDRKLTHIYTCLCSLLTWLVIVH